MFLHLFFFTVTYEESQDVQFSQTKNLQKH